MAGSSHYCLLWIPASGLFYDGGGFFDGNRDRVPWRGTLPVFKTHAKAVTAKKKMKQRFPEAHGSFVVLKVLLKGDAISEEDWGGAEIYGDEAEVLVLQEGAEAELQAGESANLREDGGEGDGEDVKQLREERSRVRGDFL